MHFAAALVSASWSGTAFRLSQILLNNSYIPIQTLKYLETMHYFIEINFLYQWSRMWQLCIGRVTGSSSGGTGGLTAVLVLNL